MRIGARPPVEWEGFTSRFELCLPGLMGWLTSVLQVLSAKSLFWKQANSLPHGICSQARSLGEPSRPPSFPLPSPSSQTSVRSHGKIFPHIVEKSKRFRLCRLCVALFLVMRRPAATEGAVGNPQCWKD